MIIRPIRIKSSYWSNYSNYLVFLLSVFFALSSSMKRFFKSYWPSMLVVLVIIYATWIPRPLPEDTLPIIPHLDKVIHAIMFGGFAGAMMFDYYRIKVNGLHRPLTMNIIISFAVVAAVFAGIDEYVQGELNIGRPSDFYDLLADWAGVLVACFAAPPVVRTIFKSPRDLR